MGASLGLGGCSQEKAERTVSLCGPGGASAASWPQEGPLELCSHRGQGMQTLGQEQPRIRRWRGQGKMSLGLAQPDEFSPLFHTFPHPHAKAAGAIVPSREGCQGDWSYSQPVRSAQKILPQLGGKRCRRGSTVQVPVPGPAVSVS